MTATTVLPATAAVTSLHLTRLQLDPAHPLVQKDLRNGREMHRTVMSLFPQANGDTPRSDLGVLFRIEPQRHGLIMLVQSFIPAHLDALPVGYSTAADQRSLAPVLEWIQPGLPVRYRIVAHPTAVRGTGATDTRSRRVSLDGQEAADWWIRKAEAAGMDLHPGGTGHLAAPIRLGRSLAHRPVRFEGTATLTDTNAVHSALRYGIGQGKPYGCGLLSLAPHTPTRG
ncbi:type I-E CRISPR-associated protein Cas6/Cse3/CasE [Streptomyces caniferus]|uniref:type I-E CRISPR-associated protein Cas6/Cse3/CasE n=1 Tax=Streptomyces caniferus TaxID=285557 RepID=UPI0037FB6068